MFGGLKNLVPKTPRSLPSGNISQESETPKLKMNLQLFAHEKGSAIEGAKQAKQIGLKEFDIAPYGDFKKYPNDNLTGHELLQNAWLESNGKIAKRGQGISKDNPAIALYEDPIHKFISGRQRTLGLNKKNLAGASWRQNVLDNIQIMKEAGVPRDKIAELAKQTRRFAIDNGF